MCMVRTDVLPMHLGALERTQQIHTGPSNLPAPRRPFAARTQALQMEELDSFLHGTPPNDSMLQIEEIGLSGVLRQTQQAPSNVTTIANGQIIQMTQCHK